MAKRFKFRKMYFVCKNGKVINDNVEMTNAYRRKEVADSVCKTWNERGLKIWDDQKQPEPVYTVHAFYLVHEILFRDDE